MQRKMRKGLSSWVETTRATRQDIDRRGLKDPAAIKNAINRSLGNKDTYDPQGTQTHPKRRK